MRRTGRKTVSVCMVLHTASEVLSAMHQASTQPRLRQCPKLACTSSQDSSESTLSAQGYYTTYSPVCTCRTGRSHLQRADGNGAKHMQMFLDTSPSAMRYGVPPSAPAARRPINMQLRKCHYRNNKCYPTPTPHHSTTSQAIAKQCITIVDKLGRTGHKH